MSIEALEKIRTSVHHKMFEKYQNERAPKARRWMEFGTRRSLLNHNTDVVQIQCMCDHESHFSRIIHSVEIIQFASFLLNFVGSYAYVFGIELIPASRKRKASCLSRSCTSTTVFEFFQTRINQFEACYNNNTIMI